MFTNYLFIIQWLFMNSLCLIRVVVCENRVRIIVFNATFNNISVILWKSVLLVEPGENYRPDASHWQTLSHNVVSSTLWCIHYYYHTSYFSPSWSWSYGSSYCVTLVFTTITMLHTSVRRGRDRIAVLIVLHLYSLLLPCFILQSVVIA